MSADPDELRKYRELLVTTKYKVSESYDKAVFLLSGGAIGISLTLLREIAPSPKPHSIFWLGVSWLLLVLSLVATFISILTSQFSYRRAIRQVDDGTIYSQTAGGPLSRVTIWLNVAAAVLFILGISGLLVFALVNVS